MEQNLQGLSLKKTSFNESKGLKKSPFLPLLFFVAVLFTGLGAGGFWIVNRKRVEGGKRDCTYENVNYSEGEVFKAKDNVNQCLCNDGNVVCTKLEISEDSSNEDEDKDIEEDDSTNSDVYQPTIPSGWVSIEDDVCNFGFALPEQDFYEAKKVDGIISDEDRNKSQMWVYEEIVDPVDDKHYMGYEYDSLMYIGYLPGGVSRMAWGCGTGCANETMIYLYCREDSRSLDEIVDDYIEGIDPSWKEFESSMQEKRWGTDVYKITTSQGKIDDPATEQYILTNGAKSYLIMFYGGEVTQAETILGTFDFSI